MATEALTEAPLDLILLFSRGRGTDYEVLLGIPLQIQLFIWS